MESESALDATVAICTFNGSQRIGRVLESLACQQTRGETWEVLVVNNASTDATDRVCRTLARGFPVALRIVAEPRPGLSYARGCAAQYARGKIVCFLDDDTPAEPNFVAAAVQAFQQYPDAGCLGGKIKPIWETPPTPLALEVCDFALAICDYGDQPFRYDPEAGGPVGAGICVRRDVLLEAYANDSWAAGNPGPFGKKRVSGSEMALNAVIFQLGYSQWYVPNLVIHHIIPEERMRLEYLARLYESIGRGQAMVRRISDPKARHPILRRLIGIKDLARWLWGSVSGPGRRLKEKPPALRRQLHRLKQKQLWGRAMQAIAHNGSVG